MKYFAYLRKSTESDEKQVHSIADQRAEVQRLIDRLGIQVVDWFAESQSARKLGRPVFAEMLGRIESGEAQGIVAWQPDRLARNHIDGGQLIQMLDEGAVLDLKFANFLFENTSQGKFNLGMAFVQSKYYTDNLRENIERGIRNRLEQGVYPSGAKRGYLKHPRSKDIQPDPRTFHLIAEMFDLYLTGQYSYKRLAEEMYRRGLHAKPNKRYTVAGIVARLSDPFYYGAFTYRGELHKGTHRPAVSYATWKAAQRMMEKRTRKQPEAKTYGPFAGMIRCASCGYSITSEHRTKRQVSGKTHQYVYYHCTKKGKQGCNEPYIRQEALLAQFMDMLQQVALPESWAVPMLEQVETWEREEGSRVSALVSELDLSIEKIAAKLRRLGDLHIDGEITRLEYRVRKEPLLNEKIALEERRAELLSKGANAWLEPLRGLINAVRERNVLKAGGDLQALRNLVAQVGSNLELGSRNLAWVWLNPMPLLAERGECSGWWAILDSNQ